MSLSLSGGSGGDGSIQGIILAECYSLMQSWPTFNPVAAIGNDSLKSFILHY